MAALGLALAIGCAVMLPSAYRIQKNFNGRREQAHKIRVEGATNQQLQRYSKE
jgi:hypothetical protein